MTPRRKFGKIAGQHLDPAPFTEMQISEALRLVRSKYLDEQKGVEGGETAEQYRDAASRWPATMQTAHILWARELSKNMP